MGVIADARALSSDLAKIPEPVVANVSGWKRVQWRERVLSGTMADLVKCGGREARPTRTCR